MKKVFSYAAVFFISLFASLRLRADSPLTSTFWANQYKEVPIINEVIQKAKSGDQIFTKKHYDFLIDSKNLIAHKLTLINANGWNLNGLNNSKGLLESFFSKYKVKNENEFIEKANSHDLIVYAYCLAMDNYFDVSKAANIAEKAYKKNTEIEKENSYAVNLIYAIIICQIYLDDISSWCNIFLIPNNVKKNYDSGKLKKDFKQEAAQEIYDYLFIYKDLCDK